MGTCGGCDDSFGGLLTCHCARCHETFSRIVLFDAHQSGKRCLNPARMKDTDGEPLMRIDPTRGIWIGASEKEWAEVFSKKES